MSDSYSLEKFLTYWGDEGASYTRHGDYQWMASLVPGQRVLEIGCGLGFGTEALLQRSLQVFALDELAECTAATQRRTAAYSDSLQTLTADLTQLTAEQLATITEFAPDTVVCWLMGAPSERTGAKSGDGGRAVVAYRQKLHRQIAELATRLPSVQHLHLLDRSAIAWAAKDMGRDILANYHREHTIKDLPWLALREHATYRKLQGSTQQVSLVHVSALRGAVPVLASLLMPRQVA